MLSSFKDSFSVSKKINFYNIPIEIPDNFTLVYDEDTELEAFSLERSIISLKGTFVKSISLYEFSFLENPYSGNFKDTVIFVNDYNKANIILDNTWALENTGYLITCNNKIKGKGNIKVLYFSGELCEVNISLSLIKKVASDVNNKRAEEIIRELENINSLDQWLLAKINEIDFDKEIFLSPVFFPALTLMRKYLNKDVKRFYDIPTSKDLIFITSGVDSIISRKKEFELRNSMFNIREIILDIDPLLAPIYLILMTYLFKLVKGGV